MHCDPAPAAADTDLCSDMSYPCHVWSDTGNYCHSDYCAECGESVFAGKLIVGMFHGNYLVSRDYSHS